MEAMEGHGEGFGPHAETRRSGVELAQTSNSVRTRLGADLAAAEAAGWSPASPGAQIRSGVFFSMALVCSQGSEMYW